MRRYISQDVWLHLLAEGGWHRPSEVRDALVLEGEQASHTLGHMARNGIVAKRESSGKLRRGQNSSPEYAVTLDCRLPEGVTLRKIQEAMQGVGPPPRE